MTKDQVMAVVSNRRQGDDRVPGRTVIDTLCVVTQEIVKWHLFSIICSLGTVMADSVTEVFSLGTLTRHMLHVLRIASPFICTPGLLWCFRNNEDNNRELGKAVFPL